ncbi:YcxB family protein [Thalassotalea atypica]|uniref:YcxB family protein n=1 Tax=Thalassotalea atypica TaxID=2054316 RepID=UPI0025748A00|nr:YcxB family protein [Thalassotalea atypica]
MTDSFHFENTFHLDKSHFSECYSETAVQDDSFRPYTKSAVLIVFSLTIMIATEISAYMSYFVFGLGIIEALGVYYRKPWWIYRQLLSKAANNEVTLIIDEQGISTQSSFVNLTFAWRDIQSLSKSALGWVFICQGTQHYISDRSLNEQAQQFLVGQQSAVEQTALNASEKS